MVSDGCILVGVNCFFMKFQYHPAVVGPHLNLCNDEVFGYQTSDPSFVYSVWNIYKSDCFPGQSPLGRPLRHGRRDRRFVFGRNSMFFRSEVTGKKETSEQGGLLFRLGTTFRI
jgi:hypothetical protein